MASNTEPSVSARLFAILGAFEADPNPLKVPQIAKLAQLPTSTAYRMVKDLENWGALDKNPDGSYQIGVRIWELGQQAGVSQRERVVRPFLQDLFDLVHENVHIAVRQGARALYVDKIYSSKRIPMLTQIGSKLPLHATAVGRVLLAAEPDWFIKAYLEKKLAAPTEKTLLEREALIAELRLVARQGYAITLEQMRLGASSIAVPLVLGKQTVAAVGLVLESDRASELLPLLPALRGTVDRIQKTLAPTRRAGVPFQIQDL